MNHSEKIYPQWINYLTLVINQLLDQEAATDNQTQETENEEFNEEKDTTEESSMFLWDWCLYSDNEKVEEIYVGDTQTMKSTPKYYNLDSKRAMENTPLPSKTTLATRNINPPTVA
jgi:type IV secretory pathway VirB9-like protein